MGTPPEPFKPIFDSIARRVVECTIPRSISRHFRHLNTTREIIDYLTKRFDHAHQQTDVEKKSNVKEVTYGNCRTRERATRDEEQVATEWRVGEKGETPRGRDDEAAPATGPGMKTTDHHRTDSVSLATPASGPQVDQKVVLDLVKPPPSPSSVTSTTPPKRTRTQPHANEPHGMGRVVAGRDNDDEDRRAHECADEDRRAHECADDPVNSVDTSTDETAASATASASIDAAAPHRDEAEATQDQGYQPATSASAPSASHPGEDAMMPDPPRPSEDPGTRQATTSVVQTHPQSHPTCLRARRGEGARNGLRRGC